MKKVGKWLLIGFAVFVALIVVVGVLGDTSEDSEVADKSKQPVSSEVVAETKEDEVAEEVVEEEVVEEEGTGITMDNFNKLESGMSYEEIVAILGAEGEIMSETEVGGIKTAMYMWDANSFGANMNVMVQDDALISKAQFGLK